MDPAELKETIDMVSGTYTAQIEQLKAKMIHAKMKNADKYNSVEEIPTSLVFEVLERMKALVAKKDDKIENSDTPKE
jgi:hypothetical protein